MANRSSMIARGRLGLRNIFERSERDEGYQKSLFYFAVAIICFLFFWRNYGDISSLVGWSGQWHAEIGGDTPRYVDGAASLLQGDPLTMRQSLYIGYIYLLAAFASVGLSYDASVIVNLLATLLAIISLYDLGRRFAGRAVGFVTAAFWAENPDIATWNGFLLPDALFGNIQIVAVYAVYRARISGGRWYGAALALLTLSVTLRPNGWVLVAGVILYLFFCYVRSTAFRAGALALFFVLFALLVLSIPKMENESNITQNLVSGTVVWGTDAWRMTMPREEGQKWETLHDGLSYVAHHPFASLALGIAHVAVELIHVRPYFPLRMNLRFAIGLGLFYGFAAYGFFVWGRKKPLTLLSVTIVSGYLLLIAGTFATYNSRFLLNILPLLAPYMGAGLVMALRAIAGVPPLWYDAY